MIRRNPEYLSFLVRLWREPAAGARRSTASTLETPLDERSPEAGAPSAVGEWLAQVECIPDGEKRYFASLEELFAFLRELVSS